MRKLLLISSNTIHTYKYLQLVETYFDEVLLITNQKSTVYDYPTVELSFNLKIKNIFALNALAQARGTKVINIHSFNAVECNSFEWPIGLEEFCIWCKHKGFAHTDGGHYFKDAHAQFAKYVYENYSGIV